jgi:hypothetical protein
LKEIKYCFDGKGLQCNTWYEDGRIERCKLLDLWKCTKEKEAQFEVLKKCFRPQNYIGFRFLTRNNKAVWEDAVAVRSIGTGISDSKGDKFYSSCEFVHYKGDFHLKQIMDGGDFDDGVTVTVPGDYDWKSKLEHTFNYLSVLPLEIYFHRFFELNDTI